MNKTAADVEREVEASRTDLNRTVEALKDKMTPGQLFDEAAQAMGGAGQQVLSKLVDQIKENPMPLAVMGLGLAWLMSTSGKKQGDRDYDRYSSGGRYRGYDEHRSFTQSDDGNGIRDRLHDMGEKASGAVSDAKDRLTDLGASAKERGRQAVHGMGDAVGNAADRAYAYGDQAKRTVSNIFESEPLIIGAVGLVVGAAIGASLPSTSVEDRAVGPLRDKVLDKGKELAHDGVQQASEVAQAVYSTAKDEIQKSGEETNTDPVQRASDVARAAVRAGKDQLENRGPEPSADPGNPL